jgi:hypothetical protein
VAEISQYEVSHRQADGFNEWCKARKGPLSRASDQDGNAAWGRAAKRQH